MIKAERCSHKEEIGILTSFTNLSFSTFGVERAIPAHCRVRVRNCKDEDNKHSSQGES